MMGPHQAVYGALLIAPLLLPAAALGQAHEAGVSIPAASMAVEPAPAVLANRSTLAGVVEVALIAAPARLELIPGVETDVYAYNGRIPGPILEVTEGDRVVVHFRNDLPEPTTVHWHGLHLPVDSDGSPLNPVAPGEERTFAFTLLPGSAGTYWYHPHPHHRTGYQVAMGLYGGIIVRDPDDPLPSSLTERVLILTDNRFLPDGSFDIPDPHSHHGRIDFENGREGDVLFVNGEIMPTLAIRSGEVQRWRVVNASAGRYYRLHLDGHSFLHVGNDGGLFERPREVNEILLASAERVELLVRGTASPGTEVLLQSLPYDRYIPQTRPPNWAEVRNLLQLVYSEEAPVEPTALPSTLRPVPVLDPGAATATRLMVMTQGMINGQVMDMDRVDVHTTLGATEVWEVQNLVGLDHPFHLHGFQFQVIDRDGVPEPFTSWKDVVNVPKHQSVRFVVRYDNYPGKWMFHCHILDHEDHGMMGILEVHQLN